ncbi:MAG TPA: ABC transporter permease [Pseudonocardia sp.]|nr:ABC transporter permease [Pseudonocardia sp.]
MSFGEALRTALRSLRAHKLRSMLTMLGIIIGVTAVIVLVGFGDGMKAGFNKTFGELSKAIIIEKAQGNVPGGGTPKELRDADVIALQKAPALEEVVPLLSSTALIQYGPGTQFRGQAFGSTTRFLGVNNRELERGSMFTGDDEQTKNRVVVIGPEVVAALFKGKAGAALGKEVRIANTTFTVTGVLRSDGNFDDIALMPLSTARAYIFGGDNDITSMAAKAVSVAQVPAAVDQINKIMDARHKIQEDSKRDFKITALRKQIDQFNQFVRYLTMFIVAVAAISLVVGGIGVANIMLVSVTERTREIGIRKAVGAPRAAIMKQFLLESITLAGIGGAIGTGVAVTVIKIGEHVIPKVAPDFGAPILSAPPVIIAFGVSIAIGLVAGGYPAVRAAWMRPVEALRFE